MNTLTLDIILKKIHGYIDVLEKNPSAKCDTIFILKQIIKPDVSTKKKIIRKRKPTLEERLAKLN